MHKPTLLAATLVLTGAAGLALAQTAPSPATPPAAPSAPPAQARAPMPQTPPGPPGQRAEGPGPRGPGPGPEGRGPGMDGPPGRGPWMMGGYGHPGMGEGYPMHMWHHAPRSRAASFHVERGDAEIHIQCAEGEPTRACVDAASVLLDKIAALPGGR
ncbi:hypothetical protein SAMN02745194_03964 [Roseomonas rosea]|uniref:Uncharacterized protein n=1 Tax=Muricoccus roseus TaxID=198092 RepID=A0A1M6P077_9PROT|nr:hypothetical protein [Roseomonas rosea]SHK01331.1 hypothetical protein SAMN02745194_03964 [Roseomonas rosea]